MAGMTMRFLTVFLISLAVAMTAGESASAQQSQGGRFALVIGNAAYPDSNTPLKDPLADARDMANELRRNGFDVDLGENFTRNAIAGALDQLYGKIKPGSIALIFFSGYGIQSNRQSYMMPVDAQIWTEADVRRDGFSMDRILRELNTRGANIKIAVLNASRQNPFERRFRAAAEGLAPAITAGNTLIMYSAAPGTVVSTSGSEQRLFVTELVKQMRAPGLTGEEVFIRTRFSVAKESRDQQTPWVSSSLTERFYFDPKAAPDPKPQAAKSEPDKPKDFAPAAANSEVAKAPAPKTPDGWPRPASDPDAQTRRDYLRAEEVGTRDGWNDFLDKHPSGHYANLAKDKLAKLDPPPAFPKPAEPAKTAPAAKTTKNDEAIRELDRLIRRNPSDVEAHYKRGTLYAQNGDYILAIDDFNEVIRRRPNHADALNNRCWARAMREDFQRALEDCDKALEIRPRFVNALDSRALVNLKMGQPTRALTDYDASLRIEGRQAASLYGRGIAKMRSGNTSGGNRDIAAAKSINPNIAEEFDKYGIR
jgi:uncharacterized caspase-like protein